MKATSAIIVVLLVALQVGRTVQEFFQSSSVPLEMEESFKDYLRVKASKCALLHLFIYIFVYVFIYKSQETLSSSSNIFTVGFHSGHGANGLRGLVGCKTEPWLASSFPSKKGIRHHLKP